MSSSYSNVFWVFTIFSIIDHGKINSILNLQKQCVTFKQKFLHALSMKLFSMFFSETAVLYVKNMKISTNIRNVLKISFYDNRPPSVSLTQRSIRLWIFDSIFKIGSTLKCRNALAFEFTSVTQNSLILNFLAIDV